MILQCKFTVEDYVAAYRTFAQRGARLWMSRLCLFAGIGSLLFGVWLTTLPKGSFSLALPMFLISGSSAGRGGDRRVVEPSRTGLNFSKSTWFTLTNKEFVSTALSALSAGHGRHSQGLQKARKSSSSSCHASPLQYSPNASSEQERLINFARFSVEGFRGNNPGGASTIYNMS